MHNISSFFIYSHYFHAMKNLDFSNTEIELLITHHVGNKQIEGELLLTEELTTIDEEFTNTLLRSYFLSKFQPYGFQQFAHSSDIDLNEAYSMIKTTFEDKERFIEMSRNLAGLLFDTSDHPKIKDGEMNMVYFNNVEWDGEMVDAIGLFKSESVVPFIQMIEAEREYSIHHDFGFDMNGLDKACLILNTNKENGYNVLAFDKTNGNNEAAFWVEKFLRIVPADDDYNNTKSFLQSTKHFISSNLNDDPRVSKTDELDIMDRTMEYFKSNDQFDKQEFSATVLRTPSLIDSFNSFDEDISNNLSRHQKFDISEKAVKSQSKIYKSVLKLDKNFHIYIHGDRSLIERGQDEDGRKFYKVYFNEEN